MKHTQTETLIHEGACIHYQWKPGRPANINANEPKEYPEIVITSVKRGDLELLNALENIGTAGELALESFVEAIKLDNPGRE